MTLDKGKFVKKDKWVLDTDGTNLMDILALIILILITYN